MSKWERYYWRDLFGGPKYWPWGGEGVYGAPSLDEGGLNYGDRLLWDLDTGMHNMHNNFDIQPYQMRMHLDFELSSFLDHTEMSLWQKSMAPGWCYMGDMDGNAKNPPEIQYPLELLHMRISEHSYCPIGSMWTKEEEELAEIFKGLRSGSIRPYVNPEEIVVDPRLLNMFGGFRVTPEVKFTYLKGYDQKTFLNPVWKEKWADVNKFDGEYKGYIIFENKEDWVARGVLGDQFTIAKINGEQELLSIITYTDLKKAGDLTVGDRLYLDDNFHIDIDEVEPNVGILGFDEVMEILDPITSLGIGINSIFTYVGAFCVMHWCFGMYYWYAMEIYGFRILGWSERFRMRKFMGVDTRNTEAKRIEAEYIAGIQGDAVEEAKVLNIQIISLNENIWYYSYHMTNFWKNMIESLDLFVGIL